MSLLFRVVYAAHAKGSHHKLALDALMRLTRADAAQWQRVFLKHVDLYLEGSKAPDNEFKDFKNHVLHVRDGFWGGAPAKAESWYAKLVTALKESNWGEAAWCAGVLSHYVTDPVHPFHTAQSDAENSIHRAVEWSINRAYDDLRREAELRGGIAMVAAGDGAHWLADLVCRGAETSNRHYEALIAHYDFNVGVVDPPAGLDDIAREIVGDLILYAADSFARVLERAIAEAAVAPPDVSLSVQTLLATLAMPFKWIEKRLADAEDRRTVEAMYDELMSTGRVDKTLPEDDRMVRDLHAAEVLRPNAQRLAAARVGKIADPVRPDTAARRPANAAPPPVAAGSAPAAPPPVVERAIAAAAVSPPPAAVTAAPAADRFVSALGGQPQRTDPLTERLAQLSLTSPAAERPRAAKRRRLAGSDNVEAAPAIGPRLAERLGRIGITTVTQLLDANADDVAMRLAVRHITAKTVAQWQSATRLVMDVPLIDGTAAQLLAGAGMTSAADIATADPLALSASLLHFATTPEGQRLLRDGPAPDLERIKTWVAAAATATPAAA